MTRDSGAELPPLTPPLLRMPIVVDQQGDGMPLLEKERSDRQARALGKIAPRVYTALEGASVCFL